MLTRLADLADRAVTRRLAAIVAADVAGYSRLVGHDEEGVVTALRRHRQELIDPTVLAHGGRIANTAGDSLLIEFPSVIDALRFAREMHDGMRERTAGEPRERRLAFRIGINLGDVIDQDGDLMGDGVNVAARLEALAEPGGVCVSRAVRDQARDRFDMTFEDLGEVAVKNIARPIRVFRARFGQAPPQPVPPRRRVRRKALAVIAMLILLAGAAVLVWRWTEQPSITDGPAQESRPALPLPDKPSIAVLRFQNISGNPAQDYFADGMAEDIITDLSKFAGLFVTARNSSFAFGDDSADVTEIGRALGVRYLLTGSVRRAGEEVRINVQLVDGKSGEYLWAERYDGGMEDVFSLQDRITAAIIAALSVTLSAGEEALSGQVETASAEAYDSFLRGWARYLRQTPEDLRAAIDAFEQAIELDPEYGRAHAALAAAHWQIARRWWHAEFGFTNVHRARIRAEGLLQEALRWDTPLAHQVATSMLSQQGRHTDALAEGAKALALDPNDADSYAALAGALSLAGEPDRALKLMQSAVRLNPRSPGWYHYEIGLGHFGLSNFGAAAAALERAVDLTPNDRWSKRLLVAAYGHLGRRTAAATIVDEARASWLGTDPFTIRAVAYWYPYADPADLERLTAGLRKAGLPE